MNEGREGLSGKETRGPKKKGKKQSTLKRTSSKRVRKEVLPSDATMASCSLDPESPEAQDYKASVDQVLTAQRILERAYLAAWATLDHNFAAVDKITKAVHTKHRNHKAIQ